MIRWMIAVAGAAALMVAGCGSEDPETAAGTSTSTTASAPEPASTEPAGAVTAPGDGYTPVSNVDAHAAVGKDIKAIRAALESEDFAAAEKIWTEGQNSKKDDGTMRTLAGFVEDDQIGRLVVQALQGNGAAADLNAEQRRQWVDKGIVVALERKVLGEVDSAIEKAKAGETEPGEGAPHNVDEAWAFFVAEGEGLAATAVKREADFEGVEIVAPTTAALAAAQKAAQAGDAAALTAAREDLRGAMNRVFALAVTKYANKAVEDEVAAAEGAAFAWGLRGDLPDDALAAVEAGFSKPGFKAALAVRSTLNDHVDELGIGEAVPAFAD